MTEHAIPEDPRGNYCVMIMMHTKDAAKVLSHPERVRGMVALALELQNIAPLQEEVDFTLDVYRTECEKDVTTHRIAALEAQVKTLRDAGAAVLPFDRSYAYSGRRRAFDQLREALAATEPK